MTAQTIVLHRCPWKNCDWSFFEIEGSEPSKAIFEIAQSGHLKDVHENKVPKVSPLGDDFWRGFFGSQL